MPEAQQNLKNIRYFDNTRLSDHRGCNRYFYLRHELGWSTKGIRLPLAFGGAWHDAMDAVWEAVCFEKLTDIEAVVAKGYAGFLSGWKGENGLREDYEMDPTEIQSAEPRTTSIAHEMLINYVAQRLPFLQEIELLHIELPFAVPLVPDREDFFYVGRIDKVFKKDGDIWVGEHKTSSMYAKSGYFRTNVLESYSPNSQIDGYVYSLQMMLQQPVRGVMVDLALVHKTVHEGFRFVPVMRTGSPLNAWLYEAQTEAMRIFDGLSRLEGADPQVRQDLGFLPAFPKNTNNCQGKYGPCVYKDICQFSDDPVNQILEADGVPQGFEHNIWEPFEFNKLSELGLKGERDGQ